MFVACLFGILPKASAQSPPLQQCIGGKSLFGVTGDTLSTFRYSITGGVFLDNSRADSILVQWGMERGLYRLGVQEVAYGGCEGEWIYLNIELKGWRFQFEQPQIGLAPGGTLHIPIDTKMYKNIRWSDPDVATQGITRPGEYQIWVEDMYGCRFTDTIRVVSEPSSTNNGSP